MLSNKFLPKEMEITFKELDINSKIIIKLDKDKNFIFLSKSFEKISNFTKRELIGRNFNLIVHQFISKEMLEEIWRNLNSGKKWKGAIIFKNKEGKFFWSDIEFFPIDEKGNIIEDHTKIKGYIAVLKDLSFYDKQKAIKIILN